MCADQGQFYQTRTSGDEDQEHRFHRRCNRHNIPKDRVFPIMHPINKNYRVPEKI